ncbi:ryncolin-1-like [Saccostrea cucullata]|uniref:ryncolin-1-like n=1 Tax=Saccostrea cuccullata TaxID=36930 RepID=UPI002ED12520
MEIKQKSVALLVLAILLKAKGCVIINSSEIEGQCKTKTVVLQDLINQGILMKSSLSTKLNMLSSGIEQLQCTDCNATATRQVIQGLNSALESMHNHLNMCLEKTAERAFLKDCQILLKFGFVESKVYTIYSQKGQGFRVYCDQTTDNGGWMVIQRRKDGSSDFYRNWADYKNGFGDLSNEFWLGNDKIHEIVKTGHYMLRIDMKDFDGNQRFAIYRKFNVGDEKSGYILTAGGYSGTAGDSLSHHNGQKFSTKDRDFTGRCATTYKGAWWYAKSCHLSNLNGLYLKGKHSSYADGVNWYSWHGHYYSLKETEMKIRKVNSQ